MTYNQIISRLEKIALAHKQVRTFKRGLVQDFLTDKTTKYAAIFLQETTGTLSVSNHAATFNFRIWFLDLVHVSQSTKENELDVVSDMISVALDYIATLANPNYNDWKISTSLLQTIVENDNDLNAGCFVDISISVMYSQNVCIIPSEPIDFEPTQDKDMNVYDVVYEASGDEGTTIDTSAEGSVLNVVTGKKILLITREYSPLYKVSSNPNTTEYTWNNTLIVTGLATQPNERFLILYRQYS